MDRWGLMVPRLRQKVPWVGVTEVLGGGRGTELLMIEWSAILFFIVFLSVMRRTVYRGPVREMKIIVSDVCWLIKWDTAECFFKGEVDYYPVLAATYM